MDLAATKYFVVIFFRFFLDGRKVFSEEERVILGMDLTAKVALLYMSVRLSVRPSESVTNF